MARSPLALAALATVALPGKKAIGVRPASVPGDYDAAEVTFADGDTLVAQAPATPAAVASQAMELALLEELQPRVNSHQLPFAIPEVVGKAPLFDEGGQVVLTHPLLGTPFEFEMMPPGLGLASSVGRSIAAIHELPTGILERLNFPVLSPDDCRRTYQLELEASGASGLVPTVLLQRWEGYLDDAEFWQFTPTFIHGDLAAEYLLIDGGRVSTITGWANARVADPAEDLAWLLAGVSQEAGESLQKYYQEGRQIAIDPNLFERAMVLSEFALARWLQFGLREKDPEVVADAQAMLSDLAASVSAFPDS